MKTKSLVVRIAIVSLAVVLAVVIGYFLVRWTVAIESKQRQAQLRDALQDVIDASGERGLLEMAGVPVNNIFYGDTGVTLFQGDEASWNYSADELQNMSIFQKCNQAVVHI